MTEPGTELMWLGSDLFPQLLCPLPPLGIGIIRKKTSQSRYPSLPSHTAVVVLSWHFCWSPTGLCLSCSLAFCWQLYEPWRATLRNLWVGVTLLVDVFDSEKENSMPREVCSDKIWQSQSHIWVCFVHLNTRKNVELICQYLESLTAQPRVRQTENVGVRLTPESIWIQNIHTCTVFFQVRVRSKAQNSPCPENTVMTLLE